MLFDRIAIVGLGLMGGSLAAAMKSRGLAGEIRGWDQHRDNANRGVAMGLIDKAPESLADTVSGVDLVVFAVPVMAFEAVLGDTRDALSAGTLLTDVGSVKSAVIESARKVFEEMPSTLVPGHPIAGSERHGVDAADAELFVNHKVILTPVPETDPAATGRIRKLWEAMGSSVVEIPPDHHDAVLAQTSHLPHLLAYALVDTLASADDSLQIFEYAAGGFRDFSRIAASDPVMWRDIFRANSGQVLASLDRFLDDLNNLRTLIKEGRHDELAEIFARAKEARDYFNTLLEERNNANY